MRIFSVFWTNGVRANGFRPWWALIPLLTAGNQVCAKLLAGKMTGVAFSLLWLERALWTPWFAGIVFCQIISLLLWLRILSTVKISAALPLTASSYVLIVLASVLLFREQISLPEIGGMALILLGIGLIAGGSLRSAIIVQDLDL